MKAGEHQRITMCHNHLNQQSGSNIKHTSGQAGLVMMEKEMIGPAWNYNLLDLLLSAMI